MYCVNSTNVETFCVVSLLVICNWAFTAGSIEIPIWAFIMIDGNWLKAFCGWLVVSNCCLRFESLKIADGLLLDKIPKSCQFGRACWSGQLKYTKIK